MPAPAPLTRQSGGRFYKLKVCFLRRRHSSYYTSTGKSIVEDIGGRLSHRYAETINKVSGRVEVRRLWAGLRCLIMLQRERRLDTQSQTELAFYISSLPADAPRLLQAIRDHLSIENTCHWSLDVIFAARMPRACASGTPHRNSPSCAALP
jgi:hypothetical protein